MTKATVLKSVVIMLFILETTSIQSALAEGIRVGVILPLTGNLADIGRIELKSFQMAVNEINNAGGINGEKINLLFEDTAGEPKAGRSAIKKLIRHQVCVVGGGVSSSVTWAAIKQAKKNKIPFLVNTASADKITEKDGNYIFRLNAPVSEYFVPLSSFLINVAHVKTVGILYENTLFGQSGSNEFIERCKGLKFRVVAKEAYEKGKVDFEDILLSINNRKPDLFYIIAASTGTDASLIVRQAKELNLDTKFYLGGSAGFTLTKFQVNAGAASEYVFAVTQWTPSVQYPGASDFYNKFVTKNNEHPGYHGAQAYSAMYVIADALKRAKSHTPHDVRDALRETDIMTVFGPVKFISYGKKKLQNKNPVFLGQWLNKRFESVWPKELSTVEYVYPHQSGTNSIKATNSNKKERPNSGL